MCKQLQIKHSNIPIYTLQSWQQGQHLEASDDVILKLAHQQSLTLVTYDIHTIPSLLKALGEQQQDHSGVIFVDSRTIAPNNTGQLVKSLLVLWEQESSSSWRNRTVFFEKRLD